MRTRKALCARSVSEAVLGGKIGRSNVTSVGWTGVRESFKSNDCALRIAGFFADCQMSLSTPKTRQKQGSNQAADIKTTNGIVSLTFSGDMLKGLRVRTVTEFDLEIEVSTFHHPNPDVAGTGEHPGGCNRF